MNAVLCLEINLYIMKFSMFGYIIIMGMRIWILIEVFEMQCLELNNILLVDMSNIIFIALAY